MRGRTIAAALALCVCASEAQAQQQSASTRLLDSFAKCRAIAAAEARASCFDASARELEAAVKSKDVRIVDRQEIRSARRSLFGFTLPRIGLFGGGRDEGEGNARGAEFEDIKELNTTVASARTVANGRVELRLADGGAVWMTTDPMPFPPKPGAKVRIRSGSLGNYFIAVDGQRSVRGMRLR